MLNGPADTIIVTGSALASSEAVGQGEGAGSAPATMRCAMKLRPVAETPIAATSCPLRGVTQSGRAAVRRAAVGASGRGGGRPLWRAGGH